MLLETSVMREASQVNKVLQDRLLALCQDITIDDLRAQQ